MFMLQVDAVKTPRLIGATDVLNESTLTIRRRKSDDGRNGNRPLNNLACLVAIYYVHGVRYLRQAIKNFL